MGDRRIRLAIAGVGNCASSLIQGLAYYQAVRRPEHTIGLIHSLVGDYAPSDIDICAAFDISATKVGLPLEQAVFAEPNNTLHFAEVAPSEVVVQRGPTLDGLGVSLSTMIDESPAPAVDVAAVLRDSNAEVLISYLPVGSQLATEYYANAAIEAGCAFVNCIPVFIGSDPDWQSRFEAAKLPVIGDDIKSQVGATIVHRVLTNLFKDRGVDIDRTYQLNVGGNTDFLNMLDRDRLQSKKISKTRAVASQMAGDMQSRNIHIGPSDHVPFLDDKKIAYIRIEGTGFGGAPINVELKLEVWDSPNSAGVAIDAIRCAKIALDRGICGAVEAPSSYFMKSPPVQYTDEEARRMTDDFILGDANSSEDGASRRTRELSE